MACVNTNEKSFKELISKYGASSGTVENAIKIYMDKNNLENYDPNSPDFINHMDSYFQLKSNNFYPSKGEYNRVHALWEKINPKQDIADIKTATKEYNTLVGIFGEDNVTIFETSSGRFRVRVAEPMFGDGITSDKELLEEMYDILSKAPRDKNGNLLAPNGKKSNLTERQYAQVRTKAFKEWFGDWEKYAPKSDFSKVEEQLVLVFERIPELSKIGSIREYAAYLADKFPNSVDRNVYWHGTNEDFSEGFKSAKKGKGSGAPETQSRNDFYLAKQAWTVLQYVNGVNRNSVDKNGFAHWNKLWWELKEIMSNGRRENNNWKDMVIGEETVRQGIPNKKGVFNRDKGGSNGKWLSERKADYGYENKSDKEFFEDILGVQWGKDTFNTWTKRNAEVFKALEKTQKGIYPAIINTQNPIREKGQNTYYEEQRGLFTQAERESNDAILGEQTDNEFGSDVAVVLNASEKNVHFLGTKEDVEGFKKWLEENRASKVVDENGEPLVVYHGSKNKNFSIFDYNYLRKADSGFFFSSDKEYAKQFGDIREFFLNIKNPNITNIPLNIDNVEKLLTVDYKEGTDGIQGHDDTNTNENLYHSKKQEYVALRPNQIKSATNNTGAFSKSNDRIDDFKINVEATVEYTPIGKSRQTYTIRGNKIFNKEGKEVFKTDSVDRNRIFANLAVQQGRAVVVSYKNKKYVVNNRNQIISVTTGKIMQWDEKNGDRNAIIKAAQEKFNGSHNTIKESEYSKQLIEILQMLITRIKSANIKEAKAAQNLYEWTIEAQQAILDAIEKGERKDEDLPLDRIQKNLNDLAQKTPEELAKDFIEALKEMSKDWGRSIAYSESIQKPTSFNWGRTSDNNYEVSSAGDSRFSAFNAKLKPGTKILGVTVPEEKSTFIAEKPTTTNSIEYVYQILIKKSGKDQAPSKDSKLYRTTVSSYSGDITPDANTIFVFGSNPEGRHGAGAAKVAREKFGAIYGQGEGLQGNAYALPTKDLRVTENRGLRSISESQIIENIKKLYETARQNPDKQFKVAYRNTDRASLNGYTGLEMIDMFLKAGSIPTNIVFSKEWVDTGRFNLSRKEKEDFSYAKGYLPLWQEWAKQNPELIEELRTKAVGKTLTDQFAYTRVSQARALADILNSTNTNSETVEEAPIFEEENDNMQSAKELVDRMIADSKEHIKFNPEDHSYIVDGRKADTSVTQFIHGKQDLGKWGTPSSAIGTTADTVTRDFFKGELKDSYPNLSKEDLAFLKNDLRKLKAYFDERFGEGNYRVVTTEFPIAAKYTYTDNDGNTKVGIMAGTMDMLIYDNEGNFYIYDMKTSRSGLNENKVAGYAQQLTFYKAILEAKYPELKGKIKELKLIQFRVGYPAPGENFVYSSDSNNQLYLNGTPIQEAEEYSAPYLDFTGKTLDNQVLIPVKPVNTKVQFEDLTEEEVEAMKEEVAQPESTESTESEVDNQRGNLYGNPLLSASERTFLANNVMCLTSLIITHLQTDKRANQNYFEDQFKNVDFTTMSREDIINTVGISRIFNYIRERWYNTENRPDIEDFDVLDKLDLAYNNWTALVKSAYPKLISLEGVTVVNTRPEEISLEDIETAFQEGIDSGELEEKEREYWQQGIKNISARASLSTDIRRTFGRLFAVDAQGHPIKDKFGFNFDTFVDPGLAVNSIFEWTTTATTMEEMETQLEGLREAYPWLNSILDKVKQEPFRSQFFQNFRKDFTQYSIVTVSRDERGNKVYKVQIINTKGATQSILDEITSYFNSGLMQNIIISADGIEGKGRVNVKNVEALKARKDAIISSLKEAFGSIRKNAYIAAVQKNIPEITKLLNEIGIRVDTKTVSNSFNINSRPKDINNTPVMKMLEQMTYMFDTLLSKKDAIDYNPLLKGEEKNIYGNYKSIIGFMSKYIQDSIESSCYENGKMYYSFTTPSYMGKLILNLKDAIGNYDKFESFMEDNYGSYRWFKNEDGSWNNPWLELLNSSETYRQNLEHKVQLSFDNTDYRDLSELGYTLSLMNEYFYDNSKKKWAWYRVPMLSNKPSSEFIRFTRYSGRNYQKAIKRGLRKILNQEILRFKAVLERSVNPDIETIKNFDISSKTLKNNPQIVEKLKAKKPLTHSDLVKNGKLVTSDSGASFKFLESFNLNIIAGDELGMMIIDKLNGVDVNEDTFERLVDSSLDSYMKIKVAEEFRQWEKIGLFETEEVKRGNDTEVSYKYIPNLTRSYSEIRKELFGDSKKSSKERQKLTKEQKSEILSVMRQEADANLTEYIWNDMFATINIIELTATDLAYYANVEDFQKRYAQVHSPALRLNITAKFKKGSEEIPYSADGLARTIYVADYKTESDIIPNVEEIFDQKIASITDPTEKANMKIMKDLILDSFKDVNVTDAQGYSSPTSYRKKMGMQGKWTTEMEEAYERIRKGDFNVNDLGIVWQPMKPFVYSQIRKPGGSSTLSEIKVPIQNKNSEYLLLLADALMRGGKKQSKLAAIFDFMEESAYDGRKTSFNPKTNTYEVIEEGTYNGIGIDTVQFNSAVKSGESGVIDINSVDSYEDVKKILNDAVYLNSDRTAPADNNHDRYNANYVHTYSFEDYGIQQEVPAHLADHEQLMGSQMRILSISDITPGTKFQVGDRTLESDKLIDEYQNLIKENIEESFNQLCKDFKIHGTRLERNKALERILQEAIEKDQRYGADLQRACSLDSNGEFIIPLSDPIQSVRIQQLLNSIIKSRINKQKVSGGPVVQASVFGMSDDLTIRFKDKEGNLIESYNEFIERKGLQRGEKSYKEYKNFIDGKQGSVAYFECYMPIPSAEIEKALTKYDSNGHPYIMSVDEAVKEGILNEEMLQAIGYRIPTEDKYSMIPMKIKGFLPKAAGEALMLPKEITLLTGSDFDVDKIYVMLKTFEYKERTNWSQLKKDFLNTKNVKGEERKKLKNNLDMTVQQIQFGQEFSEGSFEMEVHDYYSDNKSKYKKSGFELVKKGTSGRNNKIFDLQWAVLTNADTMSKMFNPGSFDVQKKTARIVRILQETTGHTYKELSGLTVKQLDDILNASSNKNIIFSTSQVYFHKQNMTAGKLIGIFANNNTSHAFISMQGIDLKLEDDLKFTFDGVTIDKNQNNRLDPLKGKNGSLISKTIAGFLAASVDAVKDPVLNFMNLNTFTAGSAMVLARLGFDSDSIGLLLSQPIIIKLTNEYLRRNNEGYISTDDLIDEYLEQDKNSKGYESTITLTNFTKEELAEGISLGSTSGDFQIRALILFKRLSKIATELNTLTFLTKFNSVTNAVGPTIADTLVMKQRYSKFLDKFIDGTAIFSDNAADVIQNSPILDAFYTTTISDTGASQLIFQDYFPQYSDKFIRVLDRFRETTKASLDSKTINSLVNDFVLYKLTGGPNPVLNSDRKIRKEFIYDFIKEFKERAAGIIDNDLLKIITVKPVTERCPVTTLEAKIGGYTQDVQERVKDAWTNLIANKKTRDLGVKLFFYNMYRTGVSFSPKTFLSLASTDVKLAIPGYIESIRDINYNNTFDVDDFLLQYRRNHTDNYKVVPHITQRNGMGVNLEEDGAGNKKLIFTFTSKSASAQFVVKKVKNGKRADLEQSVVSPVIVYNNKVYYNPYISGDSITYTETTALGNTNNFLEYNMNETGSGIKTALREDPKESTPEKEKLYYPEREIPEELGEDTVKELSEEDIDNIIGQVFTKTEQADFSKALMGRQTTKLNKYEKRLAEKIDSKTASKVMDILKKLC